MQIARGLTDAECALHYDDDRKPMVRSFSIQLKEARAEWQEGTNPTRVMQA